MTKKKCFIRGLMISAIVYAAAVLYTACDQPSGDETDKDGETDVPETVSGIVPSLNWIKANGKPGNSYTVTVTEDETIAPQEISAENRRGTIYFPNLKNVTITVKSAGHTAINRIRLSQRGAMFDFAAGVNLVLQDITLEGLADNTSALVVIGEGSCLEMRAGSKITGNGNIAGNGGGVRMFGDIFTMAGGSISGNTAYRGEGGGVYVNNYSAFFKTGGAVYGSDGGDLKNTAVTSGHAVYLSKPYGLSYVRNTTAGQDVMLSSDDLAANWGQ